jgi:hypothetical protein
LLLEKVLEEIDGDLVERVIPALLQASKFSNLQQKQGAMDIAKMLGVNNSPAHVRASFAYRKSSILLDRAGAF